MARRRVVRWLLWGLAAYAVVCIAFFGFWFAAAAGSSSGSPTLAAEWRDRLGRFADPEAARAADPEVIAVRFRNGEWAFGLSKSSHGVWYRGGGTVVVKGSDGRTRAFFGHVCGRGRFGFGGSEQGSLAEFYESSGTCGFREHPLP